MSRATTYSEISSLSTQLGSENHVKKRRETGQKLLSLLSNHSVRSRLAKEAAPSSVSGSRAAIAKRKALAQLWRVLIRNALMAAKKASEGRGKLNLDDVMLPYRFLSLCDISESKQEQSTHHDDGAQHGTGTRLSRKEILDLLKYCLDMLVNEAATEVAENDLLTMLHHLCGREDYVVHYRPHAEINNILAELDTRLSVPEMEQESSTSHSVFLSAAKTFSNLLQTCQRLGTGMHLVIPTCIEVVSKWCSYHFERLATRGSSSQALPYMYGGATALLNAHPEQVIAPLSRHGRPILGFAKRCFLHSQGFNKSALTEYFLAHLIVCQAAGDLQGLLPGDLGDVGSASFTVTEIDSLLSMVTSEADLDKVFLSSDPAAATRQAPRFKSAIVSQRRTAVTPQQLWSPPSSRQRCHLELCARLLACSQRLHVARAEWNVCDDPLQSLLDVVVEARKEGDEYFFIQQPVNPFSTKPLPCAPVEEISKFPWIQLIAKHLWTVAPEASESSARVHPNRGGQSEYASQHTGPISSEDWESSHRLLQNFPVLTILSQSPERDESVNTNLVIHLLRITCACAEAFPNGECWSSSTQGNWKTHVPDDLLESDVIHSNGSSVQDLASVVFLVSNVLEQYGGPGGDSNVHTWSLLCLIRFTETTSVIFQRFSEEGISTELLSSVWRRVWNTVLRADLLYSSYTEGAIESSNGELVLVLLTEMVRNCCTDPSIKWTTGANSRHGHESTFMHANQLQIWQLPAFNDTSSIQSSAALELAYAVLRYTGLTDQGRDVIDGRPPEGSHSARMPRSQYHDDRTNQSIGRRQRLLNLVFRKIEEVISSVHITMNREILCAACACSSVLLSGEGASKSTIFSTESFNRFRVTEMSNFKFDFHGRPLHLPRGSLSVLDSLWGASSSDESPYHLMQATGASRFDSAFANASIARKLLQTLERRFRSEDSESPPTSYSGTLLTVAVGYAKDLLALCSDERNEISGDAGDTVYLVNNSEARQKIDSKALSRRTAALKVLMYTVISCGTRSWDEPNAKELSEACVLVFDEILSGLPSLSSNAEEFLLVITDVYELFDATSKSFFVEDASSSQWGIVDKANEILAMCRSMLVEYAETSHVNVPTSSNQVPTLDSRGPPRESHIGSDFDSDYSDHFPTTTGRRPSTAMDSDSDSDSLMSNKRKRNTQPGKRARRRMTSRGHSNNGSVMPSQAYGIPPNGACARRLAAIMILLQPSFDSCQLVAETLLWPSLDEDYTNSGFGMQELDPEEVVYCLQLICREETIFHSQLSRKVTADRCRDSDGASSVVSLCCSVIRAIRADSGPALGQHLCSFLKCSELVAIGESDVRGDPLATSDSRDIIDVLKSESSKIESRNLKLRPQFRSTRLRVATDAFQSGRENYHREFDHMFATQIVIPSLRDLSEPVRTSACFSVGAALRVLEDQRRIVNSVLSVLPPLSQSRNERNIMTTFRKWYEEKDLGSRGALVESENMVWDDAFLSLQAVSVLCRGYIAGSTSDDKIFREILFNLVKLSYSRPELEAVCFGACERMSLLRGFRCVEEMLHDESEWLLLSWVETGIDLSSMPLMMSFPSLLRQLLRAGQVARTRLPQGTVENEEKDRIALRRFREDAVSEFVKRSAHILVPIILLYTENVHIGLASVAPPNPSANENRRAERGWEYLREACYLLDIPLDDDCTNIAKVLLKSHFPDIIAFFLPVTQENCAKGASRAIQVGASAVLQNVENKLTEVTSPGKQKRKKAHLVVRRILQLCGTFGHAFVGSELANGKYVNAITYFLEKLREADHVSRGDRGVFDGVDTSVTENLIYAKAWLSESVLVVQKERSFSVIEVLCDMVTEQLGTKGDEAIQISFCIQALLDVILEVPSVRKTALAKLKRMLTKLLAPEVASQIVENEVSSVLRRLLGTLLHVHEVCQEIFVRQCIEAHRRERTRMQGSLGLIVLGNSRRSQIGGDDLWGWSDESGMQSNRGGVDLKEAVFEHSGEVSAEISDNIVGTYELLELVLGYCTSSQGRADDVLALASVLAVARQSESLECLTAADKKYNAQALIKNALEVLDDDEGAAGVDAAITKFLAFNRSLTKHGRSVMQSMQLQTNVKAMFAANLAKNALNIDAKILLAQLDGLSSVLRGSRQSGSLPKDCSTCGDNIYSLVQELLTLCDSRTPTAIRCAASRCLGELGPSEIDGVSSIELESVYGCHLDAEELNDGDYLRLAKAKSLEVLSQLLKSPQVRTSLAAMEAVKALLSTNEGIECWRLIEDEECKRSLTPLRTNTTSTQSEIPHVSTAYMSTLVSMVIDTTEKNETASMWCWDEKLWVCVEGSFEVWVKNLVCSLIKCYYVDKSSNDRTSGFFQRCLKMCSLEHGFAASLFPGIVFDILNSNSCAGDHAEHDVKGKTDRSDILSHGGSISQGISRCFEALLGTRVADDEPELPRDVRAVSLGVYTLDTLRVLAQRHFLSSQRHAKNPSTMRSRSCSNKGKSNGHNEKPSPKASPDASQYNNVDAAPTWEGVPFGIAIDIDALQVAKACIRVKRYASALFYAEMYADNQFRGSAGVLERLSNEHDSSSCGTGSGTLCNALALSEVLQRCYLELREYDAVRAVDIQTAALQFLNEDVNTGLHSSSALDTVDDLRMLDTQCNSIETRAPTSVQVVKCMERLGLRNVLRTYVEGLVKGDSRDVFRSLSGADRLILRDRWFEGSLQSLQWNVNSLNCESMTSLPQTQSLLGNVLPTAPRELTGGTDPAVGLTKSTGDSTASFYESLAEAFGAIIHDDKESCCRRLAQARHCLLNDIQKAFAPESSLSRMVGFSDRLQVVNDLDGLASGHTTPLDLVSRWGLDDAHYPQENPIFSLDVEGTDSEGTSSYGVQELGHSAREILLRVWLCSRNPSPDGFDPQTCLVRHLWRFCSTARRHGSPDVANESLQRLRAVLKAAECNTAGLQVANSLETNLRLRLEEARILEAKGKFSGAIRTAKLVVNHLHHAQSRNDSFCEGSANLLSEALLQCGVWMDEYKVEPAESILKNYLKPASEMARTTCEQKKTRMAASRMSSAYLSLAELVANLFDNVAARIESQEWKKAGMFVEGRRKELNTCRELQEDKRQKYQESARKKRKKSSASDKQSSERLSKEFQNLYVHSRRLEKELELMTSEREKIEESVKGFLNLAIQSYGTALSICDSLASEDMSRHVFRMVSLWFSNCTDNDHTFNENVGKMVDGIPSFRFVPLTYQIFSRIESDGEQHFQEALTRLVSRMCVEHPYQTLVQLIALSNGKKIGTGVDGRHANDYLRNVGESKVMAANDIIASLKSSSPQYVSDLIDSYTALVDTYVGLAMAPTEELHKVGTKGIPLSNFKDGRLDRCMGSTNRPLFSCPPCVLSKPPPLRPGGDYGAGREDPIGAERVQGFQPRFSITETGLHRPKIVMCIGSKGGLFKQVVKGKEDIRQDAVMEQVFKCVNDLMKRRRSSKDEVRLSGGVADNSTTLHRQLKLVTYEIVPLSPTCGVLEWVNNTIPFGEYLVDKGKKGTSAYYVGAHSKYYPGEWGHVLCKEHYQHAPVDAKREAFDVICDHFSPAFRFFFVERFSHSLQAWHNAKMTYTRSCAVSSIVGHMLGIGDRHTHNILVHEKTGEVVHIDFGIVFEQGKSLTIPETVPFRLTRDVVDGMGPCGTEGTFSRAAEATAAVLRENANALLTILSAVVADPLYKWNVNPVKARERQRVVDEGTEDHIPEDKTESVEDASQAPENQNEAATRAIARIHEKLQGYEDGTSGERQSVEGQVQLLINSATDRNNLCALYYGWAPWM